jgi:hypothetical protein
MLPLAAGVVLAIALMVWMAYFMLGCLPLLILKHDTPVDSRFIRSFFNIHYLVLMGIAAVGALCFAAADRLFIAVAMACIACIGFVARRLIVSSMDRLRSTMSATDALAIRGFRQLHVTGITLNVVQLVGFGFAITRLQF